VKTKANAKVGSAIRVATRVRVNVNLAITSG